MENSEKNMSKAAGGTARARALSPERRREIAQKAAVSRWGSGERPAKQPAPKKFLKVSRVRRLSVTSQFSEDGSSLQAMSISEAGQVLRIFTGDAERVGERVESYLSALTDLGIELELAHTRLPAIAG